MAYWYREDGPNTPDETMSTFMNLFRHGLAPSDYPHERVYGEFLKDIPELLARPELTDATKQKILYDNAKEFYRI